MDLLRELRIVNINNEINLGYHEKRLWLIYFLERQHELINIRNMEKEFQVILYLLKLISYSSMIIIFYYPTLLPLTRFKSTNNFRANFLQFSLMIVDRKWNYWLILLIIRSKLYFYETLGCIKIRVMITIFLPQKWFSLYLIRSILRLFFKM